MFLPLQTLAFSGFFSGLCTKKVLVNVTYQSKTQPILWLQLVQREYLLLFSDLYLLELNIWVLDHSLGQNKTFEDVS